MCYPTSAGFAVIKWAFPFFAGKISQRFFKTGVKNAKNSSLIRILGLKQSQHTQF
jgi:hypothetical protein